MQKHTHSKETRTYLLCLALLPVFLCAAFYLHRGYSVPSLLLPPCLFHTLTGFSCPGCGCTRAVLALLRGEIRMSLRYNPAILYCAVLYILFVLSHTAACISAFILRHCQTGMPSSLSLRTNKPSVPQKEEFPSKQKELPSHCRKSPQRKRSFLSLLARLHGMKNRPVYLYILIWLFLIFGILRFFAELWQRLH